MKETTVRNSWHNHAMVDGFSRLSGDTIANFFK